MAEWQCSGGRQGQRPHQTVSVEEGELCPLCQLSRPTTGQSTVVSGSGQTSILTTLAPAAIALVILAGGAYFASKVFSPGPVAQSPSPTVTTTAPTSPASSSAQPLSGPLRLYQSPEWFSRGERALLIGTANRDRDLGVEAFKTGKYPDALNFFQKAVEGAPNDPESQIYLNNAKARQAGTPFTLAVVAPIDKNLTSAQEILRGAADAQTKFNEAGGLGNRLLEIVIVNDGNDEKRAGEIAKQLVSDPDILGVIGHNSSKATKAGLAEYEKAGLATISPTSTSTSLAGNVFFRTVPSDEAAGKKLAEYTKTNLGLDKVVIFYEAGNIYSESLEKAFETHFMQLGGQVVRKVDLIEKNFNAGVEISRSALQDQVRAAVLLPSTDSTTNAIALARANISLPPAQKLQLLGGDALYAPTTLTSGANAVEGLILAVSWVSSNTAKYAQAAESRWKGQVNWRTAATFDATQAFIKALSNSPSRETVLQQLKSINLSPDETSGEGLKFAPNGDRRGEPLLVQAIKGKGLTGSDFAFKPLNK